MRPGRPSYTILLHRDGAVESRTWRFPVWLVRTAAGLTGLAAMLLLAGVVLYAPIARAAGRVPALEAEAARLREENARVVQLAAALDSLEVQYDKVRRMLGAEAAAPPARVVRGLVAPPIRVTDSIPSGSEADGSLPSRWPLDEAGYITRGQLAGSDESHPGLDIAVREGTVVRAAGDGLVTVAASDSVYGFTVVVAHAGGFETRYGHLSRILAAVDARIPAGQAIGLSGNSGRSTAPHLHFEIRRNGQSIDPRTMVKERF